MKKSNIIILKQNKLGRFISIKEETKIIYKYIRFKLNKLNSLN